MLISIRQHLPHSQSLFSSLKHCQSVKLWHVAGDTGHSSLFGGAGASANAINAIGKLACELCRDCSQLIIEDTSINGSKATWWFQLLFAIVLPHGWLTYAYGFQFGGFITFSEAPAASSAGGQLVDACAYLRRWSARPFLCANNLPTIKGDSYYSGSSLFPMLPVTMKFRR